MTMFTKIIPMFAAGVVTVGIALSPMAVSAATPADSSVCSTGAGITTFFTDQILLSHDEGGATFDRDMTLAAGTYNVSTLSSDLQHPNDPIPNQLEEYWYFQLLANNGQTVVYESPVTTDLPNNDQTIADINLDTNVVLNQDVMRIRYIHAGYPENVQNQADLMYNSVVPSCISFETVVIAPVCTVTATIDTDNSAKAILNITTDQDGDYTINWGDETTETIASDTAMIMHEYAKAGTYTVAVSVGDASCATEVVISTSGSGVLGESITVVPEATTTTDPAVLAATTSGDTLASTGINSVLTVITGIIVVAVAYVSIRLSRNSASFYKK